MTQPRTQDTDVSSWTPFGADKTPSTGARTDTDTPPSAPRHTDTGADGQADAHQSTGRPVDGHPRLRIIDGGHTAGADVHPRQGQGAPPEDTLDAAVDEAIAAIVDASPDASTAAAASAPVETPAPGTAKSTAETTVEAPVETAPEPNSTPHTPHPDPEHPENENAAQAGTDEAETPHSTPWWAGAAAALNPSGVLFRQQASLAEIVAYADRAPYSSHKAVRALEVGWNRAIAVPVSLTLYAAAAAYKRLWRGLGTSAIGVLWIVTVHASPADTAAVWTWVVLGYWAMSAVIVPVIVTKKLGEPSMDAINFVTDHIGIALIIFASAFFLVHGLWHPWTDNGPFVSATVRHHPKLQCVSLALIGYGAVGTGGVIGGWIDTARGWIMDAATSSAEWAFGGIAALAVIIASVLIWIDYIVPEGLEPNSDKPIAHLIMWGFSVLLWPMMQLAFGVISPVWFLVFYVGMWILNTKFRKKPAAAPVNVSVR